MLTRRETATETEIAAVRERLAGRPVELIGWALQRFDPGRLAVVTGLQMEGVAVADMAITLDPTVRLMTIDTGRLPNASHSYLDTLRAHWQRDVEILRPEPIQLEVFNGDHGLNPFYESVPLRLACCHLRKVAPLEGALAGVDCWMTGLRHQQSPRRARTSTVELDDRHGGIVKLNPLAEWLDADVEAYLRERDVPLHPLYSQGYQSIGCAPCTRAVGPLEDRRAGRWWWEDGVDKECGIHAVPTEARRSAH